MTLLLLLNHPPPTGPADVVLTITEPDGPLEVGDLVRHTVEFRDPDTGALADPDSVSAQVRDPYGTTRTVTPTRIAIGTYRMDVIADMDGTWSYRIAGLGPFTGVIERRFTVQPTAF